MFEPDALSPPVRTQIVADFDRPALQALITHAQHHAPKPLDPSAPRRLVIKAVVERQRPRRPAGAEAKPVRMVRNKR